MEHSLQKREAISLRIWGSKAETGKATGQPTLKPSTASPHGSLFIPGAAVQYLLRAGRCPNPWETPGGH